MNATFVRLVDCDILAVTNACILIGYKAKTYWVGKKDINNPEQYNHGQHHVTVEVTEEYAIEEGISCE